METKAVDDTIHTILISFLCPVILEAIKSLTSSSTSVVLSQEHRQFNSGPYSELSELAGKLDRDERHLALGKKREITINRN